MTPHIVPTGWTKGQALRQHGGNKVSPKARYPGHGPFPRHHSIALCQDFGKWPPLIPDIAPDTVYAISFHDADDVNQWLDWWYSPETVSDRTTEES